MVIKIDIVKPIPPSIPAPNMWGHFNFFGKVQKPEFTPIKEKSKIPKGFPITNPKTIPNVFVWSKPSCQSGSMAMHVFAMANNGKIRNATGLCKKCCSL
ncbi:hypothetical protein D3C84_958130 [compost metagenome]